MSDAADWVKRARVAEEIGERAHEALNSRDPGRTLDSLGEIFALAQSEIERQQAEIASLTGALAIERRTLNQTCDDRKSDTDE